jgi:hypothetical protein
MSLSPGAGKPAEPSMLVNVPRLMTAYYACRADPAVPERSKRIRTKRRPAFVHCAPGRTSLPPSLPRNDLYIGPPGLQHWLSPLRQCSSTGRPTSFQAVAPHRGVQRSYSPSAGAYRLLKPSDLQNSNLGRSTNSCGLPSAFPLLRIRSCPPIAIPSDSVIYSRSSRTT